MAVAGDDDIHDYTTKWVEIVNRGGLFPINNKSYQLFIAIESVVVQSLSTSYVSTAVKAEHCIKSHALNTCLKNEQVLEKWRVLTKYIEFEKPKEKMRLLEDTVNLWITIRGFSLAATWLDTYKLNAKISTKKRKVYASLFYQNELYIY